MITRTRVRRPARRGCRGIAFRRFGRDLRLVFGHHGCCRRSNCVMQLVQSWKLSMWTMPSKLYRQTYRTAVVQSGVECDCLWWGELGMYSILQMCNLSILSHESLRVSRASVIYHLQPYDSLFTRSRRPFHTTPFTPNTSDFSLPLHILTQYGARTRPSVYHQQRMALVCPACLPHEAQADPTARSSTPPRTQAQRSSSPSCNACR